MTTTIKPKIVFCDVDGEDLIEKIVAETGVEMEIVSLYDTGKHAPFSDFQIEREPEENFQPRHVEDLRETLVILLTSGTTGTAKGVCTSHISWLGQLQSYFMYVTSRRHSRYTYCINFFIDFRVPPIIQWGLTRMYWLIGTLTVIGSIITEGTWIMSSNFEIDNIAKVIEKHKVI